MYFLQAAVQRQNSGHTNVTKCRKRYTKNRQCKKQHKAIEPGNGLQRQHAPLRRQVAGEHKREKGEGDEQDGEHGAWDCLSSAQGMPDPWLAPV